MLYQNLIVLNRILRGCPESKDTSGVVR